MSKNKPPSVKPVRRYRKPVYPGHRDPDPTLHPYPVEYPLSAKLAAALATLGVAASCSKLPEADTPAAKQQPLTVNDDCPSGHAQPTINAVNDDDPRREHDDADMEWVRPGTGVGWPFGGSSFTVNQLLAYRSGSNEYGSVPLDEESENVRKAKDWPRITSNPFAMKYSGLPYTPIHYGTGAPHYMNSARAQEVIERVFADAGIRLQSHFPYRREGIAFTADGYDPSARIGYVVADDNLDFDADIESIGPLDPEVSMRPDAIAASRLERVHFYYRHDPQFAEVIKKIDDVGKIPDATRRTTAMIAISDEIDVRLLSLAEARLKEQTELARKEFIAVISPWDDRLYPSDRSLPFINAAISFHEATQSHRETVAKWRDYLRDHPAEQAAKFPQAKADICAAAAAVRSTIAKCKDARTAAAQTEFERLEQLCREYIRWARSQGAQ